MNKWDELKRLISPMSQIKLDPAATGSRSTKDKSSHATLFLICSSLSVIGGFVTGSYIWELTGMGPENSGGAFIFLSGSCIMSTISIGSMILSKRRSIFYGLNTFTFATLLLLIWSAV